MKKLLVTIMLISITLPQIIFAQTEEEKKSSFHMGLIPRPSDKEYTNTASFNLLVGISKNETAFTFGGLTNIIYNNAKGLQFAGLTNVIGNDAKGLQFAGLYNKIGNDGLGLEFGGLVNLSGSSYTGLQYAGLLNQTKTMNGFQFGGLANIGEDVSGFQFAGLFNKSTTIKGVQFSGIANLAENVSGFQFAGLFNKAKNVKGVQFAALVNVADHSDYPIGLINIIKDGEKSIGITYDETGSTILGLRTGGRVLYGILGIGYNHKAKEEEWIVQGGFGAYIPVIERFRINCELTAQHITNFSDNENYINKSSFAILPAFTLTPGLEIFAGPSINYMYTDNPENSKIFPKNNLWKHTTESKREQLYIGYTAGIQFIF